jgi:hypothetical protein
MHILLQEVVAVGARHQVIPGQEAQTNSATVSIRNLGRAVPEGCSITYLERGNLSARLKMTCTLGGDLGSRRHKAASGSFAYDRRYVARLRITSRPL